MLRLGRKALEGFPKGQPGGGYSLVIGCCTELQGRLASASEATRSKEGSLRPLVSRACLVFLLSVCMVVAKSLPACMVEVTRSHRCPAKLSAICTNPDASLILEVKTGLSMLLLGPHRTHFILAYQSALPVLCFSCLVYSRMLRISPSSSLKFAPGGKNRTF